MIYWLPGSINRQSWDNILFGEKMDINIRQLQDEDIPVCAGLYAEIFARPPWNESWEVNHAHDRISHFMSSSQSICLAAEIDGALVGFLQGEIEQWQDRMQLYLKEICVHPNHLRQGIGRAMMQRLSDLLKKVGVSQIVLISSRLGGSYDFFSKLGFSANETLVVMSTRLST